MNAGKSTGKKSKEKEIKGREKSEK